MREAPRHSKITAGVVSEQIAQYECRASSGKYGGGIDVSE